METLLKSNLILNLIPCLLITAAAFTGLAVLIIAGVIQPKLAKTQQKKIKK